QILFAPASIVGLIEGIATATQNIVQGFSGSLSDKIQNQKLLAIIGYALAAFSKPFVGISNIWPEVLGARFFDRLATGIRSAPRDGLIAQSADDRHKGKAFGLEGIGDNLGAFLGPILAVLLLFALHLNIRTIFLLTFFPAIISAVLILFVKERKITKKVDDKSSNTSQIASDISLRHFPTPYWKYILITAIFGVGNSSNAFLILRTKDLGIPLITTILIYGGFNLVAAISSFPAGSLSDKLGRKKILFAGFGIFTLTYIGFALSTNIFLIGFLFILYGVFSGLYRAVGKATAVDFVTHSRRASAVGWYATIVGLSGLFASIIAGQLWVAISPESVFYFGTITGILGIISLIFLL
ncbi:MAG TPA: MFS transporter, partial [Patescibacteria group bacterium]